MSNLKLFKELGEDEQRQLTSFKIYFDAKIPKLAREKCLSELKKLKSIVLCQQKQLL